MGSWGCFSANWAANLSRLGSPPNTKMACGSLGTGLVMSGDKQGNPKIMQPALNSPDKAVIELLLGLVIIMLLLKI